MPIGIILDNIWELIMFRRGSFLARGERLPRLINMIFVIQNQPGLSAKEIASRCKISQRQCFRDLEDLQKAGVPIYNDRGYRLVETFEMRSSSFTIEEAFSLIYGLKLVERQKGILNLSAGLKEKLLALLPKALGEQLEEMDTKVDSAEGALIDYSDKEELFKLINIAITRNQTMKIVYYTFSRDSVGDREIDCYKLIFKDGFWYLIAFCHDRESVRLFRVDRIREAVVLDKYFTPPENFNFEEYMGAAWQMERGEEFVFKVRFSGESVRYVKETQFHQTQRIIEEDDGTIIYTAKACGYKSVMRWILGFGSEAEVLEPVELREKVRDELFKSTERYFEKIC